MNKDHAVTMRSPRDRLPWPDVRISSASPRKGVSRTYRLTIANCEISRARKSPDRDLQASGMRIKIGDEDTCRGIITSRDLEISVEFSDRSRSNRRNPRKLLTDRRYFRLHGSRADAHTRVSRAPFNLAGRQISRHTSKCSRNSFQRSSGANMEIIRARYGNDTDRCRIIGIDRRHLDGIQQTVPAM